jgi:hypothetical protein
MEVSSWLGECADGWRGLKTNVGLRSCKYRVRCSSSNSSSRALLKIRCIEPSFLRTGDAPENALIPSDDGNTLSLENEETGVEFLKSQDHDDFLAD